VGKTLRKKVNSLALSVKQEKFCLEYAKSGNQRQAYLLAGYECKSDEAIDAAASRLLRNVKVKERLAELAEEAKNASIADIVEMQQTLTSIIRKQMTEEVIVVESVGDYMTEARKMDKEPSIKDIINAINTLGKMQGAFVEKVQQEVDMDLNIVVDYGDGE
jgi:phage terminase small subunit